MTTSSPLDPGAWSSGFVWDLDFGIGDFSSRLLGWRDGADRIRGHDLITLIEPLLRGFDFSRTGRGKHETGSDRDLDDLLVEKFRQMVRRTRLGDEFRRLRQLRDLLVRQFRRSHERDDGIRFGIVLNRAHETSARKSGAQSILSLVLRIQLMLLDLVIAKFFEGPPEC